jgi:hypothetical protein
MLEVRIVGDLGSAEVGTGAGIEDDTLGSVTGKMGAEIIEEDGLGSAVDKIGIEDDDLESVLGSATDKRSTRIEGDDLASVMDKAVIEGDRLGSVDKEIGPGIEGNAPDTMFVL